MLSTATVAMPTWPWPHAPNEETFVAPTYSTRPPCLHSQHSHGRHAFTLNTATAAMPSLSARPRPPCLHSRHGHGRHAFTLSTAASATLTLRAHSRHAQTYCHHGHAHWVHYNFSIDVIYWLFLKEKITSSKIPSNYVLLQFARYLSSTCWRRMWKVVVNSKSSKFLGTLNYPVCGKELFFSVCFQKAYETLKLPIDKFLF